MGAGTGINNQAKSPRGGGRCPFCKTGILTQSRSDDLFCPTCGQVIPVPQKSSSLLEGARKALSQGAQIATLVFDSFRQSLPEGVRTVAPRARQLLYQAGKFTVDLRLDTGPDGAFLVGQVMDSTRPDQGVADVPVTLFRSRTSVSKTVTNTLGEFQSELEDPNELRLSIAIDEECPILIDLQGLENGRGR